MRQRKRPNSRKLGARDRTIGKMASRSAVGHLDGPRGSDSPLLAPSTAQDAGVPRASSTTKAMRLSSFMVTAGKVVGQRQPRPLYLTLWVWSHPHRTAPALPAAVS